MQNKRDYGEEPMNSSGELLSLNNVSARYSDGLYSDRNALDDISFSLPKIAGLIALIGPNGSGKTTILRVITGQLPIIKGLIRLSGIDITNEPTFKRNGLGCVFQRALDGMCYSLTVEENLNLMLMQHKPSLLKPLVTADHKAKLIKRSQQIMSITNSKSSIISNLSNILNRLPDKFSGGETQQLCLLALLLQEPPPSLVLADEPTLNLDAENRKICLDMLLELSKVTTVLLATHDKELISISIGSLSLDNGRLAGFYDFKTGNQVGD